MRAAGADGAKWSEGSVPGPTVDTNLRDDCLNCGSKRGVWCGWNKFPVVRQLLILCRLNRKFVQ